MFAQLCSEQPVGLFHYEATILVCMVRLLEVNKVHLGASTMEFLSNMEMMERRSPGPGMMACPFQVIHNVASAH